ncbi:uncharacterized protein LMH87_008973 [Akanthomyces muscarius]|uniref:Ricin B lectin domain-containing protein n=1 Tax=Akanthomyces muscarius TaxID=2231603 RepID=A0A9W8QK92_AKAMU|nr:uncharacterized protein LMH87_008973 [Akanthomyces muscarius]KAJ4158447.1 hypothetical protein LMH87_008973 [Akanthomyces muscarius]
MLFTKSPIKPATSIDSNVWYHVTEGRVDRAGRKFGSMLQVDKSTGGLKVFPITKPPYYWQFQALNSSASASPALYVVRNSLDGAAKQLSACRNETEPADGQTGLCMAPANGADDAQVWQIDQWGGSGDMARDGLRFINAANGTGLWLDVHSGNPPFMNSSIDADGDKGEPSQHWYMTSAQAVNAIEYSTIQTIDPASAGATATTASTTADSEATASATSGPDSTSGLSTGGQAGIGIGVGLAVIALAVAALFLWRRRKAQNLASTSRSLPPIGSEKKFHQLPSELPDADAAASPHSAAFHLLQELPATAARSSSQIAHEAQTQRYELDSTPVVPR